MITVGYDYNGVLNKYPKLFAAHSRIIRALGGKVIVISAYPSVLDGEAYKNKLIQEFKEINFVYDRIIVFTFDRNDPTTIPSNKLVECKMYSVDMFFDDRGDVVNILNQNGIEAIRV